MAERTTCTMPEAQAMGAIDTFKETMKQSIRASES
jgi:hypothetical protein